MAPTFLIVGATGNTGRSAVSTVSEHLSENFPNHRILALTRSKDSDAAKALANLQGVEVAEKNWVDITPEYLKENEVVRAFIASHNRPNQFAEESTFHLACLHAGVEYVVRISTTAANVTPTCNAYYPRQHWAVEQLLSSEEFEGLKWSSLQPNVFTQLYLSPAIELVKQYKKTGTQVPLKIMANEDAPVGIIDPSEVGIFAGTLLLQKDISPYNHGKFELNGPVDITGREIVAMVEKEIGTKVTDVQFQNLDFIADMAEKEETETKSVIASIKYAPETAWEGKACTKTTSKEFLELAPPKRSPEVVWRKLLEG